MHKRHLPLPLLVACAPAPAPHAHDTDPAVDTASPTTPDHTDVEDTDAETPDDSDTDLLGDSAAPIVDTAGPGPDLCFPGPLSAWDLCLPTVRRGAWGSDWAYPPSSNTQYRAPVHFLDLDALDPATRLAPSFALSELAQAYKGRWGVVQPGFVARLQAVRDDVGGPVSANSGYRSPAWNAGVGGATFSRHMWGDAADVRSVEVSLEELGAICLANDAGWVGFYEGHVHCDWRDDPLDPVLFGSTFAAGTSADVDGGRGARLVPGTPWTAPATGWDEGEPLRTWRAWDASGRLVASARARTFTPPAGAAEVEVEVGREIRLRASVP